MIQFSIDIRFHTIADGPFTFILESLRMNVLHAVNGLDDFRRDTDDEGIRRDDLIFQNKRAGSNDGTAADLGACQNSRMHADEDMILNGAGMDAGTVPDGDIVAYSVLCPHKGWLLSYNAGDKTLNCPGHHSRFDCESGGHQIWGHATQNLPQFKLRVEDNGDIYADGVDELIYGRLSNVLA